MITPPVLPRESAASGASPGAVDPASLFRAGSAALLVFLGAACSGAAPQPASRPGALIAPDTARAPSNLRVVAPPSRPRLALLVRDGDPAPALVAVVATDLGPAPTVALSAVVEARLLAAGLAVDARVDRSAFRVRLLGGSTSAKVFFGALVEAFRAPLGPGTPEVAKASERLAALRRNPLPAPEAAPAADCAGRLGLAPRDHVLDPLTPDGLAELETARTRALTAARTALAAVGPAPFCEGAERALAEVDGWAAGSPPEDAWPASDTTGTHAANDVGRGRARVTVAVRLGEPVAAVAAAERLAEPHGPLRSRLAALPSPFRVTEVLGVARPRGGCISVTAETDDDAAFGRDALTGTSALVAAIARKEIAAQASVTVAPETAARAVVSAADPRDAAARAAWWALAGSAQGEPDRWATVLALAPDDRGDLSGAARRFQASLAAATSAAAAPVVERRAAVEQGQGELWVLLASPCGAADEGPLDAGASALAALAAAAGAGRSAGLPVDPWITAEGVGVVAHAAAESGEDPSSLARRVAGAAARAFAGEVLARDAVASARATALARIERAAGPHGAAMGGLLGALSPQHPSQLFALGPFARVAALAVPGVAGRWQSLADGPLRMAVLANGGAAQANAAFDAADHWLSPRVLPREPTSGGARPPEGGAPMGGPHPAARACTAVSDAALAPGRHEVELPAGAELAHALVAVNVASRGHPGHELAALAAHLLGGERGLAQAALDRTPIPAVATVRLLGGARSAALVIDVRAPQAALDDAVAEIKALLARLGQEGPPEQAVVDARAKKQREGQDAGFDPRSRLVKLWLGEAPAAEPAPTRAALQSFFGTSFRESALVVVEAKRK